MPRDRLATFDPQLIAKYRRRLPRPGQAEQPRHGPTTQGTTPKATTASTPLDCLTPLSGEEVSSSGFAEISVSIDTGSDAALKDKGLLVPWPAHAGRPCGTGSSALRSMGGEILDATVVQARPALMVEERHSSVANHCGLIRTWIVTPRCLPNFHNISYPIFSNILILRRKDAAHL